MSRAGLPAQGVEEGQIVVLLELAGCHVAHSPRQVFKYLCPLTASVELMRFWLTPNCLMKRNFGGDASDRALAYLVTTSAPPPALNIKYQI